MKNITLKASEIASMVNGELFGDPDRTITGVAGIRDAKESDLSFVGSKTYEEMLNDSAAGIVLISEDIKSRDTEKRTLILCKHVDHAFGNIAAKFADEPPAWKVGIHPSAAISESAKIGQGVSIGAHVTIEDDAEISDGACIGAGCYIGHGAKVGAASILYPNVTLMYRCTIGRKCIIHPGVVIGADGFGFVPGPNGLVKVPQTGIVEIHDDVEIGANTTVDRARFGKTVIKSNVKIDDQVMVAHNVEVGESSILVAQCGIAGSSRIGQGVIIAAKAGINGHITIGDGSKVAGTSGVVKSLPPNSVVVGTPAEGQRDFIARLALPNKVEKLSAQLKALKAELAELKALK